MNIRIVKKKTGLYCSDGVMYYANSIKEVLNQITKGYKNV